MSLTATIPAICRRLDAAYGEQPWHWMPDYVRAPIDVVAGAILVQHTIWANAERALDALREAGALGIGALASMPEREIASLVRVSGTPTVKAKRLRAVALMIDGEGGLDAFLALPLDRMRPLLLATHGIGPETADAIALYAAGRRTFVIDAYTKRLFRRIGIAPAGDRYDVWQRAFETALPDADAGDFQRYHAAIVLHGKDVCRATPHCTACPLVDSCTYGRAQILESSAAAITQVSVRSQRTPSESSATNRRRASTPSGAR